MLWPGIHTPLLMEGENRAEGWKGTEREDSRDSLPLTLPAPDFTELRAQQGWWGQSSILLWGLLLLRALICDKKSGPLFPEAEDSDTSMVKQTSPPDHCRGPGLLRGAAWDDGWWAGIPAIHGHCLLLSSAASGFRLLVMGFWSDLPRSASVPTLPFPCGHGAEGRGWGDQLDAEGTLECRLWIGTESLWRQIKKRTLITWMLIRWCW